MKGGKSSGGTSIIPPTAWTVMHRLAHGVSDSTITREFWSLVSAAYNVSIGWKEAPYVANQLFDFRSARKRDTDIEEMIYEIVTHTMVTGFKPRMTLPAEMHLPTLRDEPFKRVLSKEEAQNLGLQFLRTVISRVKGNLRSMVGQYFIR